MAKSAIFEQCYEVKAEHIDALGHVNNVCYIAWMQDTALAHSEYLGLGLAEYQQLNHAMVAVEHHAHYRKPLLLGQKVMLRTWLADLNALYSVRRYVFFNPENHDVYFMGETKWACVELKTGRAKRMSPTFTQAYQPLADDINPYDFQQRYIMNEDVK